MSASHEAESSHGSSLVDRRFKLSRACDRCRRRRIRCDEGHPCKSCVGARSSCTFEEIGKKPPISKPKRSTLEERMQQMEQFISALPPSFFNAGASAGVASVPDTTGNVQSNLPSMFGVPPPSLSARPLVNPSRYFTPTSHTPMTTNMYQDASHFQSHIHGATTPVPLASSYLYLDDQGSTRWQGEMSGFPLLDTLIERKSHSPCFAAESPDSARQTSPTLAASDDDPSSPAPRDWFPDRQSAHDPVRPEDVWMTIAQVIPPELMDHLVLLFLKTTYYLMPFIHVPSFIADYQNPNKWDTGFGSFIVAICCLTSRHVDDVRVRADSTDAFSAGATYFDLFLRLRSLPGADRPTLYTVQSVLLAAVYAIGRGRLSKGLALLAESITLCIDAGLHRSVEQYDHFDPIETEVRKRTFWSVYAWDKQASVYFGRPPLIRLRDCDVPEPEFIDDEFITKDGLGVQPPGKTSLMTAFVATNRLYVIIEGVLDVRPIPRPSATPNHFLSRASSALSGFRQGKDLKEAELMLEEWSRLLPSYWSVTPETMASRDVIRITQAERLHCLEHFVRMLINRYRFSLRIQDSGDSGPDDAKDAAIKAAQRSALQIIAKHLEISSLGLMTYYGLFVIHQLTQAGRTLIAILLECKNDNPTTASSLEALKACVGLLRRFSGRYVCGLRSADLLEETCRLNHIPLEIADQPRPVSMRPAWLRPVRKRAGAKGGSSDHTSSPIAYSAPNDTFFEDLLDNKSSRGISVPVPNMDISLSNSTAYNPGYLQMGGGGLVEPLTQGSLAPFTADMFGTEDVGAFLAYLGGSSMVDTSPLGGPMIQPLNSLAFAPDGTLSSSSLTPASGSSPALH